jgi:hypothetical protein
LDRRYGSLKSREEYHKGFFCQEKNILKKFWFSDDFKCFKITVAIEVEKDMIFERKHSGFFWVEG